MSPFPNILMHVCSSIVSIFLPIPIFYPLLTLFFWFVNFPIIFKDDSWFPFLSSFPSHITNTLFLSPHHQTPKALPRRPMSSPVHASFFLTAGKHSPERAASALPATPHSPRRHVVAPEIKMPTLGDKVLLGPQNLSFIIALPEPDIGLVQMESIPGMYWFVDIPGVFTVFQLCYSRVTEAGSDAGLRSITVHPEVHGQSYRLLF